MGQIVSIKKLGNVLNSQLKAWWLSLIGNIKEHTLGRNSYKK